MSGGPGSGEDWAMGIFAVIVIAIVLMIGGYLVADFLSYL